MRVEEFLLGLRVKRRSDESSFVRDRPGNPSYIGRRVGIVVGLPEPVSTRHRAAMIQWEGTTRSERVLVHRLEALPTKQQPVALGGEWVADDTTFVAKRPVAQAKGA
jgi:hypothetical protein